MILGLPWSSWLLLLVAVGLGFGISLAFYLAHRGEDVGDPGARPGPGPGSSRPTNPDYGSPSDGSTERGAPPILDPPPGRD
jgi:hypothetical protein